jgi:cyclophilin family peptidyl-prolyl cis-trans isomerase
VGEEAKSGTHRWLVVATAVAGLIAAVIVTATRYYELKKARLEAAQAESQLKPDTPPSPVVPSGGQRSPIPKSTGTDVSPNKKEAIQKEPIQKEPAAPQPPPNRGGRPRLRVETTHGAFTVELHDQMAPKTVEGFRSLVQSKSLDGTRLTWMRIGNRQAIDKDKKAADTPMAANVRLAPSTPLRWLDPVPTDTFARRGDLCIDQKYGEDQAKIVITQVQGAVAGRFPFGRVVEGWETVDKLCDGHWIKKDSLPPQYGGRYPSLFLDTVEVRIKTVRELSSE